MRGAAAAFVLQNLAQCAVNAWWLQRREPGLQWRTPRLRMAVLQEGVRYGLSIQMLVLCYLLIESGAKLMLVRGGFLAAVSYFDMAFRIGKGVRALLSSALRVLVPRLTAQLHIEGQRAAVYAQSFGLVVAVALPIFVGALAGAQGLSWLVVGRNEPGFVAAVGLALVPWLAYSLIDPAINNAMATGRMRWALAGHLLKVALAMALVAMPVMRSSAVGVFACVALSMVIGSGAMLVAVHLREDLAWRLLSPAATVAALVGGVGVGLLGALDARPWSHPGGAAHALMVGAVYGLYVGALWRWHPGGQRLWGLMTDVVSAGWRKGAKA
jgi:O-antigen/teichoic acid export membrane protein